MSSPQIDITEDSVDDRTHVLHVRGEVHVSTAPELSSRLNDAIDVGRTAIVIDLSEVEFIDSTGLSVLLSAQRRIDRAAGRMALVCANPTVMRLFEITHLDSTFAILATGEEALKHVRGGQ